MTKKRLILFICNLTLLTATTAQSIIYVDRDTPALSPDGQTWGTAFFHVQDALDLANQSPPNTFEIWVAEGTYQPNKVHPILSMNPRSRTFYIGKDLKLYGGFNGTEVSLRDRDYANNHTILNGDIGTPNDETDNVYHIVKIEALAANGNITQNCIIDGFIIEAGYADGNFPDQIGGGILNLGRSPTNSSSLTVRNCVIRDNYAAIEGGGLYNIGDNAGAINPTIVNCSFYNNVAPQGGAAIRNTGDDGNILSSFIITNCSFYNNQGISTIYTSSTNNGLMENTILVGVGGIEFVDFGTATVIENSLSSSNACPSNVTCTNTIFDTDPLFVDPMNGNLQLQISSPAIDQGNTAAVGLAGITRDLQNSNRLSSPCTNLIVDIGAYERQFTAPNAGYTMANALSGVQSMTREYVTDHSIESDQTIDGGMANAINVTYQAGLSNPTNRIELLPNFEVVVDQLFHAFFSNGCP